MDNFEEKKKNKVIRHKSRASALSKKVWQRDRQTVIFFNKAGYTATPVACGWAGAVFEIIWAGAVRPQKKRAKK